MKSQMKMFVLAVIILILITAVILGLVVDYTSPITWILVIALGGIPFLHKKFMAEKFLQWKDEYSVGIESIDRDHKKLISLINQLQTAVDYSTDEEFEREALDAALDYTRHHFELEENMMSENGYPEYEAHKAEHQKMIDKVNTLMGSYAQNPHNTLHDAQVFLKEWLIHHINGTDQKYSGFLRDKGVK
ncbi:MAG: bacteriohemerythrin [Gammaproteobacteria bacterium]|nr:bacteriohemerythrin [Gammaproteobacteria bacterium]